MNSEVLIAGDQNAAFRSLSEALIGLSPALTIAATQAGCTTQAGTLILMPGEPDHAIAIATNFAATAATDHDRLVLFISAPADNLRWPSTRDASTLAAFTRHAALAWARLNVRVNVIVADDRGTPPTVSAREVASLCLAIRRWHSMTGQMLSLG